MQELSARCAVALLAGLAAVAAAPAALHAAALPPTEPCSADATTLCIDDLPGDQRYQVRITYQTAAGGGAAGSAHAVSLAAAGFTRGGAFWFFSPDNPEVLLKVLDGCALNQHHWLLAAAVTNVAYSMVVIDTLTGEAKTYTNADQTAAAPIQDSAAFDCVDPCHGSNGSDLAAHVDSFTASAGSLILGVPQTFSWMLSGAGPFAQSLTGTDLLNVALKPGDRSYGFTPQILGQHTATLAVTGRCGSDSRMVSYDVQQACVAPHIDSFSTQYASSATSFCAGDNAPLSWQTSGSGDVSISPGIGAVAPSGSTNVMASAPTTYTITKTSVCGSDSATLNLAVARPVSIKSFTADSTTIPCLGQTTLRWDIEGDGVNYWLHLETTFTSRAGTGSGPMSYLWTPSVCQAGNTENLTLYLQAWGTCPHQETAQLAVTID